MTHGGKATFQLDLKRKLNCGVWVEEDETVDMSEFSKIYQFPEDGKAIEAEFSGVEFCPHRISEDDESYYKFMFDTFVYRGLEQQREELKLKRTSTEQTPENQKKAKTHLAADNTSSPESHESASGSVTNANSKDAEPTHPPSPSITLKS